MTFSGKNKSEGRAKKAAGSMATLRKVLTYIGNYRFLLLFSILLAGVSVVLTLYAPILFGDAIDGIVAEHKVDFELVLSILRKTAFIVLLTSAATWAMNLINNYLAFHVVEDIRARAIRKIQKLPLSYLDSHRSGDIVSRVITDVDQLSDGLLLGFSQLFSGVITILVTLIFMFRRSVLITLIVVALTPVSFLVARFIVQVAADVRRMMMTVFLRITSTRSKSTLCAATIPSIASPKRIGA